MTNANTRIAPAKRPARSPRLWTSDTHATWAGVGRLVDAHGICQTLMAQLTGGIFLTGLALALGAQEFLIGIMAALPLAAKLGQLYLSWRIERAGRWRRTALVSAVIGRAPLLVAAVLALVQPSALTLALFVAALAVAALGASAFELAFLTWTAELIPEPLRGVFWGRRGQIAGAVGIVATLVAAWLLGSDNGAVSSFPRGRLAVVFGAGALFGLLGIYFLRCLPAPRRNESRVEEVPLRQALSTPLRDHSFRQFLAFSSAWSFTAGFMAPFYMVYMLRELRLSFFVVSLLTALTNVIMSATQVYWGRLGDHFGTKPVLRIGSYLIVLAPLAWLFTSPSHVWPVIIVQIVSGLGWSAFHVSQGNLALKLSPENKRPSYLGTFGAASGAAEAVAPIIGGAILALARLAGLGSIATYKTLMAAQLVLFAATTILPRRIHEPGGRPVGHLIRVMARFRAMDASEPAKLVFEYGYFHLARLADLIAREYPRDAETI